MTILAMPASPAFRSSRFAFEGNARTFESPISRTVQTAYFLGARWRADYTLPPMRRDKAAAWLAWGASLNGQVGRFYAGDPAAKVARGIATGTPLVNGADQAGAALITDGWTPSTSGILLAGDYIAYDTASGRSLHILTADVNSDGGGNATLPIAPSIRVAPANNATIIVSAPTCVMMLANDLFDWSVDQALVYGLAFAAVEAIVP